MRSLRRSPLATPEVERIWLDTAGRLGFRVVRGDGGYATSDGRGTITIGPPEALDADDSVAQLVFHELCHAVTEGPAKLASADWGLDNTTDGDRLREHGCLRFAAHLAGGHGLRELLAPTTDYRPYHDSLPADPLAGGVDPAVAVARQALAHLAEMGWSASMDDALARTRRLAMHPAGFPWGSADQSCGTCAWRYQGGKGRPVDRCRQAAPPEADGPRVSPEMRACARWEAALDCRACGACCREAYHSVTVSARDPVVWKQPHLIVKTMRRFEIVREGSRCGALAGGDGGAPHTCTIYDDRPQACRDFALGGRHCLAARRRVGLSA